MRFLAICLSFLMVSLAAAQSPVYDPSKPNPWVDSVFNSLSAEQRIGQLFMVAAYSNDKADTAHVKYMISKYGIGGLIFMQGDPLTQAKHTNIYQSNSKVPLLIAIDGEWGLDMRLKNTVRFPRQMTLGAIPPEKDSLLYEMGREIARQCKRIGVHVNFAPVVDVNNNPANPVISSRAFGENKVDVARKGWMYASGMQSEHVLAVAKHFPGHGDTDSDSHQTLPSIMHSRQRLDSIELYPFREIFRSGVGGVMVAHLYIPALDATKNRASTLSPKVVNDLLKKELGFKGLVFTDALNMKGVSDHFGPGDVDVEALKAGNDVLLFTGNVGKAVSGIQDAIAKGEISQADVDLRCKKILYTKFWCGLSTPVHIDTSGLANGLSSHKSHHLNTLLAENAVTLLRNPGNLIPVTDLDTLKIVCVSVNPDKQNQFKKRFSCYAQADYLDMKALPADAEIEILLNRLKKYDLVVFNVQGSLYGPGSNFKVNSWILKAIRSVPKNTKVIVAVFANPYSLKIFDGIESIGLIAGYEDHDYMQDMAVQMIFGGIGAKGRLPVSVTSGMKQGAGMNSQGGLRFKYTSPEDAGYDPIKLDAIDTLLEQGIRDKAFPGCQVFLAQGLKVFYQKGIGFHTYEKRRPVQNSDVYDLASITKIASTTAAMMKLTDEHKFSLDDYLCYHLPEADSTNKMNIKIRDMMTHQAGLVDWIPFYLKTVKKGVYVPGIYNTTKSDEYSNRVANKLFIKPSYADTIWKRIFESPVSDKTEYKYSDLGLMLMKKIIDTKIDEPIQDYVSRNFYKPLGLSTMGFLPRERIPLIRIVPTEYDMKFRKQLVHGDVHDPAAAMLGGVAGHAGLFSNANDLGVLMRMYVQKGEYAGRRYIDTATINEYTRCQYCVNPDSTVESNRRGIGFDKPETESGKKSPVCDCVSYLSFGHQGFTGTVTWADPSSDLVYVFLSNRVYPDATNNKINKMGIRNRVLKIVYASKL